MTPVTGGSRLVPVLLSLVLIGPAAPAFADDDWNWDAVEAMDDAPVTRKPVAGASRATGADGDEASPIAPRSAENALPDFAAQPVQAQAMFEDLPPFDVIPSQRDSEMHPCANCHQWAISNPEPRRLKTPHDNFELKHGLHGKGGFWCFTCHDLKNGAGLKTLEGEPVAFSDAYIVCSQCHSRQAHDWAHGMHGKRIGNWQGRRQVLNCTACHYQHRPALKRRAPMPGPKVRVGLPRPAHWVSHARRERHEREKPEWAHDVDRRREAADHTHPANGADAITSKKTDEET